MNVFFIGKWIKKKTEFIGSACGVLFSFLLELSGNASQTGSSVKGLFCPFSKGKSSRLYFISP